MEKRKVFYRRNLYFFFNYYFLVNIWNLRILALKAKTDKNKEKRDADKVWNFHVLSNLLLNYICKLQAKRDKDKDNIKKKLKAGNPFFSSFFYYMYTINGMEHNQFMDVFVLIFLISWLMPVCVSSEFFLPACLSD